jgi:hypothetical protein
MHERVQERQYNSPPTVGDIFYKNGNKRQRLVTVHSYKL